MMCLIPIEMTTQFLCLIVYLRMTFPYLPSLREDTDTQVLFRSKKTPPMTKADLRPKMKDQALSRQNIFVLCPLLTLRNGKSSTQHQLKVLFFKEELRIY